MKSRGVVTAILALALVGAPVLVPDASAQQIPPTSTQDNSEADYVVPIIIGVMLGALAWPLVAPAAVITADNVVAAGGAGGVVARAAPIAGAAAAPAAAAAAWTWRSALAMPAVIGGLVGGLLGYAAAAQ
jgi:hypothetical protein